MSHILSLAETLCPTVSVQICEKYISWCLYWSCYVESNFHWIENRFQCNPHLKNIGWGIMVLVSLNKISKAFSLNSSWPSATYMSRNLQCLFPQRPRYVALISVLSSPVPHIWGVTKGSFLASPPNSRRSPASLTSPAPHICGASRTPILTRVVWKILNVVTKILVVLSHYPLP